MAVQAKGQHLGLEHGKGVSVNKGLNTCLERLRAQGGRRTGGGCETTGKAGDVLSLGSLFGFD